MGTIPDIDFMAYIDTIGIQYKQKGEELIFHHCPFCEGNGKTTKPFNVFHFNRGKQTFFCHHRNSCGSQGNLYQFKLQMGDITPISKGFSVTYKKPPHDSSITSDVDKFYQWYENKRGIKKEILERYKVGMKKVDNKSVNMIYQYFDKENKLFNRKYKNSLDKKKIWTEKCAEKNYYGLQFVDFCDDILYVVEGEDDVHAFVQTLGINQVVSIPYGANNYSVAMDNINKQFDTIITIFDCDEKGQEGAKKFASKVGYNKCYNVILPYNDMRDCVLNGVTSDVIMKCIGDCRQFKHDQICHITSLHDEYFNSFQAKKLGYMTPYSDFNKMTKGIRTSELTVLTGHTGSGKTTFAYNVAMWCESVGMPFLAMSFENRISSVVGKLIEIYTGEIVYEYDSVENKMVKLMDSDKLESVFNTLCRKDIYFLNKSGVNDGYYDLDKMVDVIEYAVKFYNVKNIVIDHLHYFLKVSNARNPVQVIDESVRKIKQLTERLDIHIILIVHPHKVTDIHGKPVKLGINSSKGSSSIAQECDNFWVIKKQENTEDDQDFDFSSEFEMLKNREFGTGRKSNMMFDVKDNCNTFYVSSDK